MNILEKISSEITFFDGGMGSLLQQRGLKAGELPEKWNIDHPEEVREIHEKYIEAGSDIITTNTFGANALKYERDGKYSVGSVVKGGVRLAREAADSVERDVFVALDLGPTGKLLKPLGDLDFDDCIGLYREIIESALDEKPDLILIETMSDGYEAKAALLAAKENSDLPVFVSMTLGEDGKLLTGGSPETIIATFEGLGADVIGLNCGLGPVQLKPLISRMFDISSTPLMVNPNAGLPKDVDGTTVYDVDSETFASVMEEIAKKGIRILGGCCGTTPEHIRRTVERCRNIPVTEITEKEDTLVTSFCRCVEIGEDPVIIGERINPTGKKRFRKALVENDIGFILNEAITQVDAGAHILDVNVGLPEIDEPAMMERVIKELQFSVNVPLQIDTSDYTAMETALRHYNGKAMINSVSGKRESMENVFPLVKKYGGVVVALCLDDEGIPKTGEGRVKIAEDIIKTAESYGIKRKDIIVDTLAMTVSADTRSALVTLDSISEIRKRFGVNTILGVSNISFGLPSRNIINSVFFAMALDRGLSAGIINPNDEDMMKSYYSFRALHNLDESCMSYIERFSTDDAKKKTEKKQGTLSLEESIIKGVKESAQDAVKALLEDMKPLDIINKKLVPSLDEVGRGFEKGTVFLPQLLMSAEAAKAAFSEIKNYLLSMGQKEEKGEKIVIATVKGDIHDIGKNIVKVLLENYGYDVIDLGKDIAPEVIVDTVLKENVRLVGLSALMTTTVKSMEETIKLLNETVPKCKTVVGGAVLTEEYAKSINADCYAKDAMATVNYAEKVFGS